VTSSVDLGERKVGGTGVVAPADQVGTVRVAAEAAQEGAVGGALILPHDMGCAGAEVERVLDAPGHSRNSGRRRVVIEERNVPVWLKARVVLQVERHFWIALDGENLRAILV